MAKGIHPLVWGGVAAFLGYLFLKADASQKRADESKITLLQKLYEERKKAGDEEGARKIMLDIELVKAMR